jgi:predicted ATPase
LVGRAADVAAVRELLLRGDVRLLTLIGAPGIGKTRLALQVVTELRDAPSTLPPPSEQAGLGHAFADGVFFIQLAPLSDPGLVIATVAQTLGVVERAGQSLHERLSAYLHDKQLLLLLDNFEHVLSAAPQLAELLAGAPGLTLLVTSRVALRLVGEQRYAVPPLAVPLLPKEAGGKLALSVVEGMKDAADLASDASHPASLIQYPSVALFMQRARAAARLRAHRGKRTGHRRDLPPAGWPAAGDRAGGDTDQPVHTTGGIRAPGAALRAADRWDAGHANPPANAAAGDRLEL